MLAQPNVTPYDLKFQVAGVPIRIHPGFWIAGVALGFDQYEPRFTLIWVVVLLISILWHEMGHALASKWQQVQPSVVLYWMGGLCYSDRNRLPTSGRLAVILGGPGAGLILALLTGLIGAMACGLTWADDLALVGFGPGDANRAFAKLGGSDSLFWFYRGMLFFNGGWTLVNLLPIWSLDGGQFLGEVLTQRGQFWGMKVTHTVSLVTAAAVALWGASEQNLFIIVFFGFFAFSNYQGLQLLNRGYGPPRDDAADWWKGSR